MRTGCAINQAYRVEVLDGSARATTDPMRGLYFDQLAEDDLLGGLFGNLTEHSRCRWLMIIEAAARHTPAAGYRGATGIFGGEQSPTRCHNCVRREALPDKRSYVITEYQAGVASLSAHRRTWLVDHLAYQQPEDQFARARPVGVDRTDYDKAAIERERVGIGAVVEECLERVPTVFRDADDQHLVIISQWSCERRKSRAAARTRSEERGVLSSASDDDGGGLQARCASSSKSWASDAAVDVALDGRADLGYQILRWAVRQHRHS